MIKKVQLGQGDFQNEKTNNFSCVGGYGYQIPVCFFCRYGDEKNEGYYIRDYQNGDDFIYLSETEDYSQEKHLFIVLWIF